MWRLSGRAYLDRSCFLVCGQPWRDKIKTAQVSDSIGVIPIRVRFSFAGCGSQHSGQLAHPLYHIKDRLNSKKSREDNRSNKKSASEKIENEEYECLSGWQARKHGLHW